MKTAFLVAVLAVLALGRPAAARDVYLNGIKLDKTTVLKNQTFEKCEVRFDEKGDLWITAKGYDIKVLKDKKKVDDTETPPGNTLQKRYWLVSKQDKRGSTEYDIDVYLNGTFVKKVHSSDDPVILEVTKYVVPGENKVRMVAVKVTGDKRTSTSAADTLQLILGEGNSAGGTVTIGKPVLKYTRNASETRNFSNDYTFTGR